MLEKLVSPIHKQEFISQYLHQRAVYIPGDSSKFEEFFQWRDVNELLQNARPSHEGIQVIIEGRKKNVPSSSNFNKLLSEGATLVINSAQQIDPLLQEVATSLSTECNAKVNINCYISSPDKQGFDIHYDSHDVFIVQTEGTKKWRVYEPTELWPTAEYNPQNKPENFTKYLECDLSVGDVLYIPRGHWHEALADSPCVHLTISTDPCYAHDFLPWLLKEWVSHEPLLRKDMPFTDLNTLGGDRSEKDLEQYVNDLAEKLGNLSKDKALLKEKIYEYGLIKNELPPQYDLPHIGVLDDWITLETKFVAVPNQKFLIHVHEEGKFHVIARGHKMLFTHVPEPLIETAFSSESEFNGQDLLDQGNKEQPDLDWDKVKSFLKTLYVNGIIIRKPD